MMNTRDKDTYDVNELASLLGITPWDDLLEHNPDAYSEVYVFAYDEAIKEGLSESRAEEKALDAEGRAMNGDYQRWKSSLISVAETYLINFHLGLEESSKKYSRFKIVSENWDKSATKLMETINGVGLFYFNSLKEFKESIPVKSSRPLTLSHLHWVKRYGDVYGEHSPSTLMDKRMRNF